MRIKIKVEADNTVSILEQVYTTIVTITEEGTDKIITLDIEDPEELINIQIPPSEGED